MADQTSGARTIVVRRLLSSSRSLWLAVAAAVVGAAAVAGWGLATRSGADRVIAALIGVAILVVVVVLVWRRTWVDTADGTVSQSVVGVRTRRVAWADASTIDLQRNRAGQLALRVVGDSTVRMTVLAVDAGGDRSMDPDQLRMLAEQISTWAPERARVAESLRAQADHVEQGGAPRDSPLARRL